ncbi:NFACT family protein [Thalassorhabdus alkalitolerans]|uniref:Rqc2 homolog RqcH n=1 Tax=Thalassorhabdus alkalitolerans TaxID=2282697 RepID=A0ABW0YM60_9BACI
MSFDGLMTRAITNELAKELVTGRIAKVHQPYQTDLLITVRANRKNHQLLLSANPSFARMHITKEKYENPTEPPMFCMLLRKHIEGGFIQAIEQKGMERVVIITIESKDELGDTSIKKLVIEIMGRHSNVMLIDEKTNMILDSMKHLPPSVNSYRTILPGREYIEPPAQDKISPLSVNEEEVLTKLDFNQGKIDQQLVQQFSGLSPQVSKEITYRAGIGNYRKIAEVFTDLMTEVKNHLYTPEITFTDKKEYFSVIELTGVKGKKITFTNVSEMLDRFYFGKAERDRVKQQAHDLDRFLRNEWQKNKKKIKKLEKTLTDAEKAQRFQKFGELLTANLHLLKGGEKEIEVLDYYDENGGTITIPLQPEKSPSENTQIYFRKYNKAKNSVEIVKEQITKATEEMDYLEQLIQQLQSAAPKDVEEIREELEEEGYVKRKKSKKNKKKKNQKPELASFRSSEGIPILVGKNNKQNEYLTNKLAQQRETWLHTKDIPGSHVVIRSTDFGEETLKEAANIAAYFSKAKDSSSVPVDYTLIKHVKKPNGAKPGYVIYDEQTTIFVTPDEDLIHSLQQK